MKRILLISLWLFTSFIIVAQDIDHQPLMSKGTIPNEFLSSSYIKYDKAKAELKKENLRNREEKTKTEFLLKSNYNIDRILRSGNVLFGDKVTNYINDVADVVFESTPELREELRFYTLKSTTVNAFSTNQGIVFVNLGLLAQVENEAQLAFVLAHEVIHYKNKHVMDGYTETQEIKRGEGDYNKYSYSQKIEAFYNYSKDNETEADVEGLTDFYLKTEYSPQEVERVFDVLLYSYLPFDEVLFEKSFLENEYFNLSEKYLLDELKEISAVEDYDDSESTHPSIKSRRENIYTELENISNENNKKFIVGEDKFKEIQKIARFEICRIQAETKNYGEAFYNTFVMLKKYPNSKFLRKNMAQILYGLTKYKNLGKSSDVLSSYKKKEGNWQQVFYYFRKISKKELNVISLNYAWNLQIDYPNDKEITNIANDLIEDLVSYHDTRYSFFKTEPKETVSTFVELSKAEYNKLSKYEKIDYKKERSKNKISDVQIKYALIDLVKQADFKNTYKKIYSENIKKEEDDKEKLSYEEAEKLKRKDKLYGKKIGVDKIVLTNPIYSEHDYRKESSMKYIDSEETQEEIIELYQKHAKKINLDVQLLDIRNLKNNEHDKFNFYVKYNKWFGEFINTYDIEDLINNETTYSFELMNKKYSEELIAEYGTKYFAWVGTRLARTKKEGIGYVLIYTAIYFPLLPLGIYYAVTPEYNTEYYFLLMDLEENKVIFSNYKSYGAKLNNAVLNSVIYDNLNQIKQK